MEIMKFINNWINDYVKNRDIIQKNIKSLTELDNIITITRKDGTKAIYIPLEYLSQSVLSKNSIKEALNNKDSAVFLVVLNTSTNLKVLVSSWNKFKSFRNLQLIFINPFSEMDYRWIICPYTHSLVCSPDSLEQGLKALFDGVGEINKNLISKE